MKKVLKVSDIDYSFQAHPVSGNLILKRNAEAIKQSVKTLVMLNFFEKPFVDDISPNIKNQLFEDFNYVTEKQLKQRLEITLEKYEQRIVVDNIFLSSIDNTLNVSIEYTIIGEESGTDVVSLILTRDR